MGTKWIIPAAALLLGACSHTGTQPAAVHPLLKDGAQVGFMGMGTGLTFEVTDRHNATSFARENAAFRVADESEETFVHSLHEDFPKQQTILRAGGVSLELKLGELIHSGAPEGRNGYRTGSRYRIRSAGRTLCEAESILSSEADIDAKVYGFTGPESKSFLVMEVRLGAGPRFVLFTSTGSEWSVRYVEVPVRCTPSASPMAWQLPNILGIRDGRVLLKADGVTYAYPFTSLTEVPTLEFGLG